MEIEFEGKIFTWRGPAPFFFIKVPEEYSQQIKDISPMVTYGWGVIPAFITIGDREIKTSLFPKNGNYLVPVKADLRKTENLSEGDTVKVQVRIELSNTNF